MQSKKLLAKILIMFYVFSICLSGFIVFADTSKEALPEMSVGELKEKIIENSIDLYNLNQSIEDIEDQIDQFNRFKTYRIMAGDNTSGGALDKSGPFYDYVYPTYILPAQMETQLDNLITTRDTVYVNLNFTVDSLISQLALLEEQRAIYMLSITQSEKLFKSASANNKLGKISTNDLKRAELNLNNLTLNKNKIDNNIMIIRLKLMGMAGFENIDNIRFVPERISSAAIETDKLKEHLEIAETSSIKLNMAKRSYNAIVEENKFVDNYKVFIITSDQIDYKKRLFDAEVSQMTEQKNIYTTLSSLYNQIKALNKEVAINEEKLNRNQKLLDGSRLRLKNGSMKETDVMNFEIQVVQSKLSLQNTLENRNLISKKVDILLNQGIMIQGGM
ncbi:MAG: hypothetical protein K0S61_1146 [Anaerocolumna sp.]|jgi:hypothetical protein|nr:hypothetical protein [Anaerocolumna sp.]